MNLDGVDNFTRSYIAALLWSSQDEEIPNWDSLEPSADLIERAYHECKAFRYRADCYISAAIENGTAPSHDSDEWGYAGHDFALTRNGHGAGFWDGDWPEYGDILSKISNSFGEIDVYAKGDEICNG